MDGTKKAIRVRNLKKYFGDIRAVDDLSFSVEQGELFGFLGVNGAGKSTTIHMLCTLLAPTEGFVEVCGFSPDREADSVRRHIGVVWQNNCLDDRLTVKENLYVRGSLYGMSRAGLKNSVEGVCERLRLEDVYHRPYYKLSGGQKRRCEIGAALINTPEVLFLDEPTTGLDPATRKLVWESLQRLKEEGMTVFLTTHYMEEAARAEHIAVIDRGRLTEFGTPCELKERLARDKLRLSPKQGAGGELEKLLRKMCPEGFAETGEGYLVELSDSMQAMPVLKEAEKLLTGFELLQGTMDDVFLNIVDGRGHTSPKGFGKGEEELS